MKITAVSPSVVWPGKSTKTGIPVVEILTDEGLTGWGEAPISEVPHVACDIIRSLLEPALAGRTFLPNRDEITSLWDRLYALRRSEGQTAGFLLEAMSAVDIALWDLAGKITGQSVSGLASVASPRAEVETFAANLHTADAIRLDAYIGA